MENAGQNDAMDKPAKKKPASEIAEVDTSEARPRGYGMIYRVEDRPPWADVVLMGLQHFSITFGSVLSMAMVITTPLCFHLDRSMVAQLVATACFMTGVTTIMQTGLGTRIPIVQGMSATFVGPIIVMMNMRGPCPPPLPGNATAQEVDDLREFASGRMREVQGSLCLASLVQIVIGFTGCVGILLSVIGPITIATSLVLICIPIIPIVIDSCATHWGISSFCIFLIVLFSQFLDKYDIPCPRKKKFALFTFFPILLAVGITWVVCLILTLTNVFPEDPSIYGYSARTDIYNVQIRNSDWFRIPYPGQWGIPTASVRGFVGMMAAIIAGIVDSIGDYYACALIGCVPPPPTHAINRGLGVEGIGCLLAGLWGTGSGYTSYSNNIAAIGITKVASRSVIYFSSVIFIVAGLFAKFNMFCASLPQAIIGAVMASMLGIVASVGYANLQYVKVDTSRNLFILGLALVIGLGVPGYLDRNPGSIETGSETFNQVLDIFLGSPMLLGGFAACLLDNVVRGTPEEKGAGWRGEMDKPAGGSDIKEVSGYSIYDLPYGMEWIRRAKWTRYVPFSPTFNGFGKPQCRRRRNKGDINV